MGSVTIAIYRDFLFVGPKWSKSFYLIFCLGHNLKLFKIVKVNKKFKRSFKLAHFLYTIIFEICGIQGHQTFLKFCNMHHQEAGTNQKESRSQVRLTVLYISATFPEQTTVNPSAGATLPEQT